ncbi:MAG: single-stranded DNA-binding protein [Pseudomonadota bacterium]
MARGINKVILIGNLGRDPETRYSQNGSPITNFSVATTENWRDRTSGENQERTEWHNVVVFNRLAEICGEYLRKGSKVYIEGQLRTSSWEADGQKKYRTEVYAREMQMLDSRGGGMGGGMSGGMGGGAQYDQGPPARSSSGAASADGAPALADDDFDDDIPF